MAPTIHTRVIPQTLPLTRKVHGLVDLQHVVKVLVQLLLLLLAEPKGGHSRCIGSLILLC